MVHKITIMRHLKERDDKGSLRYMVDTYMVLTEEEMLEMVLKQYAEDYDLDETYIYEASIDETVI